MSQIHSNRMHPNRESRVSFQRDLRARYTNRIEQLINDRAKLAALPLHPQAEGAFKHGFVMLLLFGVVLGTSGFFSGHVAAVVTGLLLSFFGVLILAFHSRPRRSPDLTTATEEGEPPLPSPLKDVPIDSPSIRISA